MSDFVNFNKRSISLPPGCTDLIDVLRLHGPGVEWQRPQAGTDLSRGVTRGGMTKGPAQDIEKHIRRAVAPVALTFILRIAPADERMLFCLVRGLHKPLRAFIAAETKTAQEAAVRQFLSNHHLEPPGDAATSRQFLEDLPGHWMCPVRPLPTESVVLAKLVTELFREVGWVTEHSEVSFHHYEIADVT